MLDRALRLFFLVVASLALIGVLALIVSGAWQLAVPCALLGALNLGAFYVGRPKGVRVLFQAMSAFILLWLGVGIGLATTAGTPNAQIWAGVADATLIAALLEVVGIPVGLLARPPAPLGSAAGQD